jgi:hypothetical protein
MKNHTSKTLSLRKPAEAVHAQTPAVAPTPTTPQDREFFIIWAFTRSRPRQRQATREAAIIEAERLAAINPGVPYRVYRCFLIDTMRKAR